MTSGKTEQTISRRDLLRLSVGTLAYLALSPALGVTTAGAPRKKPNIVFILADDLGWMDTSLYGSKFCETPNIDRLAKRGMMFTQAYAANPLCSPTRASIMTGQYPARIGITAPVCHLPEEKFEATASDTGAPQFKSAGCESATRLKQEYFTLAETLNAAGYRTGHFGKWHLGREPYDPLHQGFDVDVPHWFGASPAGSYLGPWKFPPNLGFQGKAGEHIEDRMAQEAVKFIKENRDQSFFLNYWAFSVHGPWDAKPGLVEKYAKKADPKSAQRNPVYGAMVQSLDEGVGRIMDTLDDLGLSDNTIIIFFSDNGGVHFKDVGGLPVTSNAPLRGGKATIYEGGTREDCIIVWPGVVKPGSKSDAIIQSVDFYPTILQMIGSKPEDAQKFDGISIVPVLRKTGDLKREAIFCYFPHNTPATGAVPSVYVRKDNWKLIRCFHQGDNFADTYELYNLKDDIGETKNLADKMPDRVKKLDTLITRFLKETNAVLPKPNRRYDPAAKPPAAG